MLNGKETFLFGCIYYGALGTPDGFLRSDLDEIAQCGFHWIRVWATWIFFETDVSAVTSEGRPREPFYSRLSRLSRILEECEKRGLILDVTLARGQGSLQSLASHMCAVESLILLLRHSNNWYLDLANEREVENSRFTDFPDLVRLREKARELSPKLLLTASHGKDIPREEL